MRAQSMQGADIAARAAGRGGPCFRPSRREGRLARKDVSETHVSDGLTNKGSEESSTNPYVVSEKGKVHVPPLHKVGFNAQDKGFG